MQPNSEEQTQQTRSFDVLLAFSYIGRVLSSIPYQHTEILYYGTPVYIFSLKMHGIVWTFYMCSQVNASYNEQFNTVKGLNLWWPEFGT